MNRRVCTSMTACVVNLIFCTVLTVDMDIETMWINVGADEYQNVITVHSSSAIY